MSKSQEKEKKKVFRRPQREFLRDIRAVRVTEGDGGDASVAIFTLPSVRMVEMLLVQFQALYLQLLRSYLHSLCAPLTVHVADTANGSCYCKLLDLSILCIKSNLYRLTTVLKMVI